MTREEWKTIMSVYQLWLTGKGEEDKDAIVASLQEAAMLRKTEEERVRLEGVRTKVNDAVTV